MPEWFVPIFAAALGSVFGATIGAWVGWFNGRRERKQARQFELWRVMAEYISLLGVTAAELRNVTRTPATDQRFTERVTGIGTRAAQIYLVCLQSETRDAIDQSRIRAIESVHKALNGQLERPVDDVADEITQQSADLVGVFRSELEASH